MSLLQLRTIAGQVLEDIDNNDSGDIPIRSVSIELKYPNVTVAMTTVTDSNGTLERSHLTPLQIFTQFSKRLHQSSSTSETLKEILPTPLR